MRRIGVECRDGLEVELGRVQLQRDVSVFVRVVS
jgi:hypothetical protein